MDVIELPPLWVPIIASFVIPVLVSAAVKPAPGDLEGLDVWEKRLRMAVAVLAAVALAAVDQLMQAGGATVDGLLTAAGAAFFAATNGYAHGWRNVIDLNSAVLPTRGMDPANAFARRAQTQPLGPSGPPL